MGADGHVNFISQAKVPAKFKKLDPSLIGWYPHVLLGTPVLFRYWDTEGHDPSPWESPADHHRTYEHLLSRAQASLRTTERDQLRRYEEAGEERKRLNALYSELDYWLETNAEDWQVWT